MSQAGSQLTLGPLDLGATRTGLLSSPSLLCYRNSTALSQVLSQDLFSGLLLHMWWCAAGGVLLVVWGVVVCCVVCCGQRLPRDWGAAAGQVQVGGQLLVTKQVRNDSAIVRKIVLYIQEQKSHDQATCSACLKKKSQDLFFW